MAVRQTTASGREALALATELLQHARKADPLAGVWEAADVQWWWRKARPSDDVDQLFWYDEGGPVAGVYLTCWREDSWQCDLLTVPDRETPALESMWAAARELVAALRTGTVAVPVHGDDVRLRELVTAAGLTPGEQSSSAWLEAGDRPSVIAPPPGFVVTDRSQSAGAPHPMRPRNGDEVAERLAQGSLYDPGLDLAVETVDGQQAGYSLYWFDPVTGSGLIEPVRVEDRFARHGLATAMLTEGIDRLVRRGAQRIKIGFGTEAASALYQGLGFRPTSLDVWYEAPVETVG